MPIYEYKCPECGAGFEKLSILEPGRATADLPEMRV